MGAVYRQWGWSSIVLLWVLRGIRVNRVKSGEAGIREGPKATALQVENYTASD